MAFIARMVGAAAAVLLCAGPATAQAPPSPGGGPACRDDTIPVTIAGKTVQAVARSCLQPDGSYRITQQTPGLPTQLFDVAAPAAAPVAQPPASAGPAPSCREYTLPVIIDGRTVQAKGRACLQADGSWRVAQDTPGLPTQIYAVPPPPPPPPSYDYGYGYSDPYASAWAYNPWFYGPPFWNGGFLFGRGFHHFGHPAFVVHGGGGHHHH